MDNEIGLISDGEGMAAIASRSDFDRCLANIISSIVAENDTW